MANLGSPERPLRVAIVGTGPSGFYAAEPLLNSKYAVKVDMFDRLPAPYGLVRYGVAPDHSKIKNVIKIYEKVAEHPQISFLGNVHVGEDITMHELRRYYDAIVIASGAETDRRLGINGEDLLNSHTATEFVGWYNGHPDYQNHYFDLNHEIAIVVGQGNVSMDICRILSKTIDELKNTDITQRALDILAQSKIKEVHMFGRRGPVQAAFTPVEIREFGELADCDPVLDPKELQLNEASQKELEAVENAARKKIMKFCSIWLPSAAAAKEGNFFSIFTAARWKSPAPEKSKRLFLRKINWSAWRIIKNRLEPAWKKNSLAGFSFAVSVIAESRSKVCRFRSKPA